MVTNVLSLNLDTFLAYSVLQRFLRGFHGITQVRRGMNEGV